MVAPNRRGQQRKARRGPTTAAQSASTRARQQGAEKWCVGPSQDGWPWRGMDEPATRASGNYGDGRGAAGPMQSVPRGEWTEAKTPPHGCRKGKGEREEAQMCETAAAAGHGDIKDRAWDRGARGTAWPVPVLIQAGSGHSMAGAGPRALLRNFKRSSTRQQ